MGHAGEELADYDEVIARLHAVPYLEFQRQVAFALCNKSNVLDRCGRFPEAEEARAKLFALFGANDDRGIQAAVTTGSRGTRRCRGPTVRYLGLAVVRLTSANIPIKSPRRQS